MARIELEPSDYGRIQFGISPLTELGCSLRMLKSPASYPLQSRWYQLTRGARERLPLHVLSVLIGPNFDTPDFFNPHAGVPREIEAQLAHVRDLPVRLLTADLERTLGRVPPVLTTFGPGMPDRLADALATFWDVAFRPHWPMMRATLEADLARRGRDLVSRGVIDTLNGCGPGVQASATGIDANVLGHDEGQLLETRGRTLCVAPSLFTLSSSVPVGDGDPMLLYPATGQHGMWSAPRIPERTTRLLGQTRSRYLCDLSSGRSSTDLSRTFGVSTSAVNQTLHAMIDQGLLQARREGRSVLYERTPLGDLLAEPQ